jgi:hypothetical protein
MGGFVVDNEVGRILWNMAKLTSGKNDVADKMEPVPKAAAKTVVPPQVPALRPVVLATKAPVPRARPWLWVGVGVLAIGMSVAGYIQPWVTQPLVIAVEVATLAPVTRILAVNGRIVSAQSVAVRPLVSGRLDALLVAEGDVVAVGQVARQGAVETYARSVALGGNIARSVLDA